MPVLGANVLQSLNGSVNAIWRSGDSRTPFHFMALSVALGIALNPLLIRGAGPLPALGIAVPLMNYFGFAMAVLRGLLHAECLSASDQEAVRRYVELPQLVHVTEPPRYGPTHRRKRTRTAHAELTGQTNLSARDIRAEAQALGRTDLLRSYARR